MASGRIPREFIDDLLNRADVVDVINARVPLKKKGREYTACCPFHNEKTPSFTVSPNKQFYHCFGCGVHGSAISFLMEYEHLDFVEAIETLADSMGVIVPREKGGKSISPEQLKRSKDLYTLLEDANNYYQLQLKNTQQAIDYLKNRGLSGEICKRYNIGYAQSGWDHILTHFSSNTATQTNVNTPYTQQQLIDAGLVIKKDDGKTYDRYRDRVMFPIRNRKGQFIGFGGRVLGDDLPKYINSPETSVFHKGKELYGLYEARKHTQKLERIIVVEGYMDVIALAQFDISYAVATLGTATTQDHIKQLFRAVPEIIFCFDGDRAGREAAWRALENAMPVMQDGKEIRFLFLPDGEDPDTQIRQIGKDAFEENYDKATSLTSYFIGNLHERFNISSREGKSRYNEEAIKILSIMPDSLTRDQLITEVSKLLNIAELSLKNRLNKAITKSNKTQQKQDSFKYNNASSKGNKIHLDVKGSIEDKKQYDPQDYSQFNPEEYEQDSQISAQFGAEQDYYQSNQQNTAANQQQNHTSTYQQKKNPKNTFVSKLSNREVRQTPVRYAISLLLSEPSLIQCIHNIEEIALSKLPGSDLLTTLIEALQENPNTKAVSLLERWRNTEFEAPLTQLMKWQPESEDIEMLESELEGCLVQIRKRADEIKIENLLHLDRTTGLTETQGQALLFLLKSRN